jgi:Glycosyl hydrolase catalytic core
VPRRLVLVISLLVLASAVLAQTATPARGLLKGVYDEANTLYGNPDVSYRTLGQLRTQVVRMNLYWGGRFGVAGIDPTVRPTDPNDGQYDWEIYDRAVLYAAQYRIKVVFSIVGTPDWANGRRGTRVVPSPRYMSQLRDFAYAAALRYSGTYRRVSDARVLPPVRHWLAWNEPNNPIWLTPQYRGRRIVSGASYAKICNAVVRGVKSTLIRGEKVACGVTAPRGNNSPFSTRPSVSPLAFLRAMKAGGAKGFDAYAHHPYYGLKRETPAAFPSSRTAVVLGNIGALDREVRRLYGPKRLWVTEYGYQTVPPRDSFGVTFRQQAAYLRQAYGIAKRHPRIDMFVWFLFKDDTKAGGWQSGFMTARGARKPSFNVFRNLR